MIKGSNDKYYPFFGVSNPKPIIEVRRSETLSGTGTKVITLDDDFINCTLIDASHPVHVVVTSTSDPESIKWVEKSSYTESPYTVTVHGTAGETFDIYISAIRIDQEKLQSLKVEGVIPIGLNISVTTIFDRSYEGLINLEIINSNEVYIQEP